MDPTSVFLEQRTHLRAVAYRLLGSVHEADDAVQETWLRLERTDLAEVDNLPGWLTTVVSRICLDELRRRTTRPTADWADVESDRPADGQAAEPAADPAAEAERADEVGRALLVVLDTLGPAERIAFCLHDLFGMSFEEIAPALGRSAVACRQLASRGRRRVRGQDTETEVDRERQHQVVTAFLAASRDGDFAGLLALLHPEAEVVSDATAATMGSPDRVVGRDRVAEFFNGRARAARVTTLDGYTAGAWTHRGDLKVVFAFTIEDGRVRQIELLAGDLDRLDVGENVRRPRRGSVR